MSPVWCSTSLEDIEHTGSIIQIAAIPMSQVWCSTSFEDIEYTGSITQIHSVPMSPVWCSTSFEDIEHIGFHHPNSFGFYVSSFVFYLF